MKKCKPLAEYAWFVEEIRNNRKEQGIELSVKKAIEEMPDDYLIKEFLVGHHKGARHPGDVCFARTGTERRRGGNA